MSLIKQLQIMLLIMFTLIFSGNFLISVNDSQQYLRTASFSKAQDTATALALALGPLVKHIEDPKIESIIKAVGDRGFFKEIRLDAIAVPLSATQLLNTASQTEFSDAGWQLKQVATNKDLGIITTNLDQLDLASQLAALEYDVTAKKQTQFIKWLHFLPAPNFNNNTQIKIDFSAVKDGVSSNGSAIVTIDTLVANDTRDTKFEQTPDWFIAMFPIDLKPAQVEVSDGWNVVAILSVSANPADAYDRLYQHATQASLYSFLALVISMTVLSLFIRWILTPLQRIRSLASQIAVGDFATIDSVPKTTELKSVTLAMNEMSEKLSHFVSKLNNDIDHINQQLNTDKLTNLALKPMFDDKLKQLLNLEHSGYVFILRINDLKSIATNNDKSYVDDLIEQFVNTLNDTLKQQSPSHCQYFCYRFIGAEFSIILQNANYQDASALTVELSEQYNQLAHKLGYNDITHMGGCPFNHLSDFDTLLASAYEALESSKQIGPNQAYVFKNSQQGRDLKQWRQLVEQCVNTGDFNVDYVNPCFKLNAELAHSSIHNPCVMVEAFTKVADQQGQPVAMATFVSIAEKYHHSAMLDQQVITKIIANIKQEKWQHQVLVNLSIPSLGDIKFIDWLEEQLTETPELASQLLFSLSAYAVADNLELFKRFSDLIHGFCGQVIIKRYDAQLLPLSVIQTIRVDAIRLAFEHTLGIAHDSEKQQFVGKMQEFSKLFNIKLYTENVTTEQDLLMLNNIGLYAASRDQQNMLIQNEQAKQEAKESSS